MTIKKVRCDNCGPEDGAGDNLVIFENGSQKCFACGFHEGNTDDGERDYVEYQKIKVSAPVVINSNQYQGFPERGISSDLCRLFGCFITRIYSNDYIVFPYGALCQKIRSLETKQFKTLGNISDREIFGANLFSTAASSIVITEGEFDCMVVKDVMGSNYNVTSLPSGASSIKAFIGQFYKEITNHDNIILCFDMDEAGKDAIEQALALLPKMKTKVATLSEKDPCEMIAKGKRTELLHAIRKAQSPLHASVLDAGSLTMQDLKFNADKGVDIPLPVLNKAMRGWRPGELTMLASFTGAGKTTLLRFLIKDLLDKGMRVGAIFLEEDAHKVTYFYFLGMEYGIDPYSLMEGKEELSEEQIQAFSEKYRNKLYLTKDEFGGIGSKVLLELLEYMAVILELDYIFFDHITIAVMGDGTSDNKFNEMNTAITKMRELVNQTKVHIVCVSHLRKTDSKQKSYEGGKRIMRGDLLGAGALSQVSDNIWSINGNILEEDSKTLRKIICHKSRLGRAQEVQCDTYDFDIELNRVIV